MRESLSQLRKLHALTCAPSLPFPIVQASKMKLVPKLLAAAILAGLSSTAAAEITIDVIGGSEVSFEGLLQADYYHYNSDVANLNTATERDGADSDQELRRAEIVFKGKGPGMWNWVAGYDAKADKFLDVNVGYRFSGNTVLTVGQFKQPNSLEEIGRAHV